VGAEHRKLYPAAFFTGGLFLVLCDLVSRSVFPAQELPVGVITSLTGGPFFLWLLYRKKSSGGAA
jgi:iron complex transport system permease protein